MKHVWLIGLMLATAYAFSGVAASSSSAAEDCYPVVEFKTGKHEDSACLDSAAAGGGYINASTTGWQPGNGRMCALTTEGGRWDDGLCAQTRGSTYIWVWMLKGKWLANGGAIEAAISSDASGELLLEDMGAPGKPDIVCNALFEGTVGPGGNDSITKIVDLEGKSPLKCTDKNSICSGTPTVTVLHLPWSTILVLSGEELRDDITSSGSGEPAYTVDCNTFIGLVEDTCEGSTSNKVTNVSEGVEDSFEGSSPSGKCTLGGEKQGLIEGKLLTTSSGGLLAADE